jgi:signal transduction histidine kinase
VDNAIKYSNPGGDIIIRTEFKDGMIETTVQDHGIGIPTNVIEHLV